MTRPTTPAPDAASDDVRAPHDPDLFARLYAASNHSGDTTTLPTGDVRGVVHAMQATDERIAHLESECERLTADLARLRAPAADLAAIGARAAAARDLTRTRRFCRDCGMDEPPEETHVGPSFSWAFHVGCSHPNTLNGGSIGTRAYALTGQSTDALIDDVTTLLALLAAERERHAAAERTFTMIEAVASDAAEYGRYPGDVPPTAAQIPDALARRAAVSVQRLAMKLRATIIERDNAVTALGHVGAGYDADIVAVWRALGREGDPPEDIDDVTEAIRDAVAERAAEVAGARAAALREAEDACANLADGYGATDSDAMAFACVAALATKGGG